MRARRLLLALAATLVAATAHAAPFVLSDGYTSQVPRDKRICITVSQDPTQTASQKDQGLVGMRSSLGTLIEAIGRQGGEVQFRSWEWFEQSRTANDLCPRWQNLGADFAVVLACNFGNLSSTPNDPPQKRYLRGDSTSAYLINIGPSIHGGNSLAEPTNPASWIGTTACSLTSVEFYGSARFVHTPRLAANDTMARQNFPYQICSGPVLGNAALNVKEVVRLFNMPGKANGDSLCAPGDTMPLAWRVRYKNSGYSGRTEPTTDWVLRCQNVNNSTPSSDIIFALICRYTTLAPIPIYANLDDYGNLGLDPRFRGSPATRPSNFIVPRASFFDSVFAEMRDVWGVQNWTVGVEADSIADYYLNFPKGNLAVVARRYPIRFATHPHNMDSTNVYAAPFGRGSDSKDSTFNTTGSRRLAHRWNPGNATVALRYGIAERFIRSDSIYRALGHRPSPWVDFPTNAWLSPNFRGTAMGVGNELTDDSLFTALVDAGKTHVRDYMGDNSGLLGIATVPVRYWSMPDQRFMTKGGGAVYSSGTVTISSLPPSGINTQRATCQDALSLALGLQTGVTRGTGGDPGTAAAIAYGETGSGPTPQWGGVRLRGMYFHPQFADVPGPADWGSTWSDPGLRGLGDFSWMRNGIFQPLNVLAEIAGRPIHVWTQPQNAYNDAQH